VRVTRLYLQNYRVYEQPVEIEVPPGLVGLYGLNGSGKSTLLESIRWSLFGRARTSIDQVRTSDVKADCVAEVEFEHEGHLYLVRRTISGANATVKASAQADGLQVAEGARDTSRYVQSVLGMDDVAFRASVFAEQKQLAALSQQRPEERRRLVLQLLGITPVDAARDRARRGAREAEQHVERVRSVLPDLDGLRAEVAARRSDEERAAAAATALDGRAAAIGADLAGAEADHDRLDLRRQEHETVAGEATAVREELARATRRVDRLAAELAELERAAAQLADLAPHASGWQAAEKRLRALETVAAAWQAVTAAVVPAAPEEPDEAGAERDRTAAEAARARVAGIDGSLRAAHQERGRAAEALARSSALSGEADCPLCGQALGHAFEQVRAHRAAELAEVDGRLAALTAERRSLLVAAEAAARQAGASAARLRQVQAAWAAYDRARARRAEAERVLHQNVALLDLHLADPASAAGLVPPLASEVAARRRAAEEVERLKGRLERRDRLEADLESERLAAGTCAGRLSTLVEKLTAVAFSAEALTTARAARDRLRRDAQTAQRELQSAHVHHAQASSAAEGAAQRLTDAEAQHAKLARHVDEARHLHRLGELLHAFRNSLVATVGPRLSAQAGALFAELTDHEYDDLDVDPDTYEIRVRDQGRLYGMDRFSGSETDLANLALRVAISEHVQFQSGGTVGLLVLDEVFGPLDDERKERMLLALERLRGRFRQVLVVTHDAAIKEQLPYAVEVVKLPGRRATVRSLTP
jgi:DNA repair exonuclease SbcCD ATPase subunit